MVNRNTAKTGKAPNGQVVTRFGAELIVKDHNNELIRCTARRKFDHVCCGDWVDWKTEQQGNASLSRIHKRKNVLTRVDFRGKPRPVAANIDQLLIILSWLPKPQWPTVDRYLIAAQLLDIKPVLVMNKADLSQAHASTEDKAALEEYKTVGYPLFHTSTQTPASLDPVFKQLHNNTSILVGQSGVGKSSISHLILPEEDIRVGRISDNGEGRHTTTTTTLYTLDNQAKIIDSPGARDYNLPELTTHDLRDGYIEFNEHAPYCRFNNCTHQHEPGCEVKRQVENGHLPYRRYERYLKQLLNNDLPHAP